MKKSQKKSQKKSVAMSSPDNSGASARSEDLQEDNLRDYAGNDSPLDDVKIAEKAKYDSQIMERLFTIVTEMSAKNDERHDQIHAKFQEMLDEKKKLKAEFIQLKNRVEHQRCEMLQIKKEMKQGQDEFCQQVSELHQEHHKSYEDSLIKGMTETAKIRFGAQAKEYYDAAAAERQEERDEMVGNTISALLDTKEHISCEVQRIEGLYRERDVQLDKAIQEAVVKEQLSISTAGVGNQKLEQMVQRRFDDTSDLLSAMNNKVIEITESCNKMTDEIRHVSRRITESQGSNTELITEIMDTVTKETQKTTESLYQISHDVNTHCLSLQESVGNSVQNMSSCVDKAISKTEALKSEMKSCIQRVNNSTFTSHESPRKSVKRSKSVRQLRRHDSDDDDSDPEDSSDDEDNDSDGSHASNASLSSDISARGASDFKAKIPAFTGKEKWNVWFKRYKGIAQRREWTKAMKLDMLLQKMEGDAGEFVYDQLSSKTRKNYKLLTRELHHRFMTVENKETFEARFDNRDKKSSESLEEYVADLRKLYDKGHPHRDHKVREEDILKRLLNGIGDDKAAFHIQRVKNIRSVDKAVAEIISFQEVKKLRSKARTRQIKVQELDASSSDESESESESGSETQVERVARAGRPPKADKNQKNEKEPPDMVPVSTSDLQQIRDQIEKFTEELAKSRSDGSSNSDSDSGHKKKSKWQRKKQNSPQWNGNRVNFRCLNCLQTGHNARECVNPTAVVTHTQIVAGQPMVATQAVTTAAGMQPNTLRANAPSWNPGYHMAQANVNGSQMNQSKPTNVAKASQ